MTARNESNFRSSKRSQKTRQRRDVTLARRRFQRGLFEPLEERRLLTATLYIDYGDAFPGGQLTDTVGNFQNAPAGSNSGPDLTQISQSPTPHSYTSGSNFTLTSFNSIFGANALLMRTEIDTLVQRYYAPFAVTVVDLTTAPQLVNGHAVHAATSLADVTADLAANNADAKHNDAYVFVGQMSIGATNFDPFFNNGGIASTQDIGAFNTHDNSAIAFVEPGFGLSSVMFYGMTVAHEAGHTFGLKHTFGNQQTSAAGIDTNLENADIMSYLDNQNEFNEFTRFPLPTGDGNTDNTVTRNAYQQMAIDDAADIGPSNMNYITGTGANNIITITAAAPGIANVTVQAFDNMNFTGPITVPGPGPATTTYTYNIDTTEPILIDPGHNTNEIILDSNLGTSVTIRGMSGTNLLMFNAHALGAVYTPNVTSPQGIDGNLSHGGALVAGSTTVNFSEFNASSTLTVSGGGAVTVNASGAAMFLTASKDGSGNSQVSGFVGANNMVPLVFNGASQLNVLGGIGNDQLTIDTSNGLIGATIQYDGGGGSNSLQLTQNGSATLQGTDTYRPGPNPGEGSDTILTGANSQTVFFKNLAPVVDLVPAATAIVTGTPSSNAINYTVGSVTTNGLITIDNQESYEFSNKTSLVINALAGDDKINLNNPNTPTGLTSITVNGQDPTASDVLVVNGIAGTTDHFVVNNLTGVGAGSVQDVSSAAGFPAIAPPVNYTGIEAIDVVGQNADSDTLAEAGTSGDDTFTVDPGADPASGLLSGYTAGFAFAPISYSGITGFVSPATSLVLLTSGSVGGLGGGGGVGGIDTVIIDGTSVDDTFVWDPTLFVPQIQVIAGGVRHTPIPLPNANPIGNVTHVIERGLDGNDTFQVAPGLTPTAFDITIEGNDSSPDPDVINYTPGPAGAAVVANLGTAGTSQSLTATGTPTVNFTDIGIVNIIGGGTLTVNGTGQNDKLDYTPTGSVSGTFVNSLNPTAFNFLGITGTFTFAEAAGAASNELTIEGTDSRDQFVLRADTRTAQVIAADGTAWKAVTLGAEVQVLSANGQQGEDTFQVTPAAGTEFARNGSIDNLVINVNGNGASNALIVWNNGATLAANQFLLVNQTSLSSGTVRPYTALVQWPDINYQGIATVVPDVVSNTAPEFQPLLIMGPDPYELNNDPPMPPVGGPLQPINMSDATFLGSGPTITAQNLTIFPNGTEFAGLGTIQGQDYDLYRVVAQVSGTLDAQIYYSLLSLLPGGGALNVEAFDAAGNLIANADGGAPAFGAQGPTGNARIRIPVVAGQSYYFEVYGDPPTNPILNPAVINGYDMSIVNSAPAIAYDGELSRSVAAGIAGAPDTGDLPPGAANSDSGRSQLDNVTKINLPTVYFRLADGTFLNDLPGNGTTDAPPAGVIPIPFQAAAGVAGYRVALFDGANAQTPVGFATETDPVNFPGLYQYTFTTALADGIHHIVAKVQIVDPAAPQETGFGDGSVSLDITIDTAPPPTFFGFSTVANDGLSPESDSGSLAPGSEATQADRITNATTPFFWGTAEANAIIRVYDDLNNNGMVDGGDLLLAETVAVPNDGTNAFPGGQWKVQSNVDLNDPRYFAVRDGLRNILVTGEDLAGNVSSSTTPDALKIFLDTQGPQVTGVQITGSPTFNLFLDKTEASFATIMPTPATNSLTISVVDQGLRDPADFPSDVALIASIAQTPGVITLVGDANGLIPIASIVVTDNPIVAGQPATATIVVTFKPLIGQNGVQTQYGLPDDRYTLTISDQLTDIAGNALDGESNAQQPVGNPKFPSGDGVPGTSFVARFTIDTNAEIGVYSDGTVNLDLNGNGHYDLTNTDYTNRDKSFVFGFTTDTLFSGVLHNPGAAPINQFDRIGAYGFANGNYRWLLDTNGDGVADQYLIQPSSVVISGVTFSMNATPFAMNYNGFQTIGLYDGRGDFFIDINGNDVIDSGDIVITTKLVGQAIIGDFDGNGKVDLGVYNENTGNFSFNLASPTGVLTGITNYTMTAASQSINGLTAGTKVTPIAEDINGDGIPDIGLFVPGRTTQSDANLAEWYFFTSHIVPGSSPAGRTGTITQDHQFSASPLGNDVSYQFGSDFALPLLGNFDPPPASDDSTPATATTLLSFNQVGTTMYVSGTGTNDAFALSATDATHYTVTVNGTSQTIDTSTVNKVVFQGASSGNSATINDAINTFSASLSAGNSVMARADFEVDVIGVSTVHVYGNAHSTASLSDPAGGTLVSTSLYSYVTGSGSLLEAVYFGTVHAAAGGSNDGAVLYPGANQSLISTPTYAETTDGGQMTMATGFHRMTAVAAAGSSSLAHLYLSGHDRLVGTKTYSYVQTVGGGLDVVMGFPSVYAYAASGGSDTASLYAAAQGALVINPTYSYLVGTGYQVMASGFGSLLGVASGTGTDSLTINAGASQTVVVTPSYATLTGTGISAQAVGFSNITASATKGSGATAYLYDSAGDDTLTAAGSTATLVTPTSRASATGFDAVDAVHSTGNDKSAVSSVDFVLTLTGDWTD